MAETAQELTIGQVAERTGLSVHALRLYEREGLLVDAVRRNASGRRVYREWEVEWLLNCTKFRASGMPLATIREFAALVRGGPGNEAERLAILRRHQEQVTDRITELTGALDLITRKVTAYEEHVAGGAARDPWTGSVPVAEESAAAGS
ncbi:MerR family transcriptional regulator [Streptomyces catenulae]|uniref:MerR family transcriptional regulator n=1 Tax=Streptomyces catenulae TaxID=66875 RepID=A0ABV2Z3W7_9ACTN|nr:MerR family transcriptional regulator [Streptomyces catenulae]